MKRRDSLKALTFSSLGLASINPQMALAEQREQASAVETGNEEIEIPAGRTKEEAIRDAKLMKETYLTKEELATITVLSDIIIPADDVSGSASSAGVPDFIAFIVKDMPQHQVPLRGGLKWLDIESNKRFKKNFVNLSHDQRINIVDDIAYPRNAKPQFSQGVAFFTLMRNLTASGFYTSKIGIDDIGYVGNTPNIWTGPPAEVLEQYKEYLP
ncbi:gluconate 2-dehydrogenase subunit 3-like protein [Dyadobacter jejuensis]|uniref:Gluconate 2-dehydrogenase subunit 3-like protein n=1 Tax=Dyadobacter jejuensis TaxID=1082580 RepID=A0A316AGK8_9BACT|nr:gluconate 2-dehydrogenase subunit 3 family protein [Dyadobacter jejuensis]PWJ56751.1 gluconate 2-dehydrogenase subunit 3-like protein [Dyadobacter jejuensis]